MLSNHVWPVAAALSIAAITSLEEKNLPRGHIRASWDLRHMCPWKRFIWWGAWRGCSSVYVFGKSFPVTFWLTLLAESHWSQRENDLHVLYVKMSLAARPWVRVPQREPEAGCSACTARKLLGLNFELVNKYYVNLKGRLSSGNTVQEVATGEWLSGNE